ncbi:ferrochelatase [Trueperella sp. LYQ141]|uniref:ferrochelatase n=1 Tax=Trueperella sp. LYQ141 TaxID=3391058 RepID=UPI003983234A
MNNTATQYGLLIVNLGSPNSPREADISEFLAAFLADHRVVHWPRWLWLPVLHGIVRRVRPRKVKPIYKSIWMGDQSPLVHYTQAQHAQLAEALPQVNVKYAMAYTAPRIAETLREFEREGVEDLTIIPLYPQYAPSTVAAITDQVFRHYLRATRIPNLRIISQFTCQKHYINWHAQALRERIDRLESRPDRIVFSFHGVPRHPRHEPEYYRTQCMETFDAICHHRAISELNIPGVLTYQSKFGPGEWIGPATIDEMARLPQEEAVRSVLVCTPGFLADCIETLDEIDVLNREAFLNAGGTDFSYLNPMNDDPAVTAMLLDLYHNAV